ncbi:MAG: CotH kinase family protein [Bacteroidales bacterium]|uniref:CotH kinase family protein n=1 Tax=Candidatus Cryptobacteroides sp. TaxID=2952915 RepID=UPI002A8096B8|nr:CotH kinase family protein [Candidatus Cryptobacteroides sp.]MDD7623083.1 CotH kinase family protein [Bacteroidales bacterium]MDY3878415.1 CotH kinase family protein [Candidatus Cryptobacteroides sp.]MDY5043397.1 CotH kinase family protein [Candidatus Cryptobacteroides sp.]
MKRITATLMTLAGLAFLFAGCKPDEPTKPNEYRQSYGIPTVSIVTDNKAPVVTREDHIPCTVKFFKTGASDPEFTSRGIIHTRGNATSGYPKKPYKIKLEEKYSMCGFPANRDWVLLAMYCDHSLMRECYMYTLSEKVGLPFTVRHQHVSVTLNGEQMGVYLLVDQVEKAEERVKLDDNGFIIERDGYYSREPLYFKTTRTGSPFTFKYPDADNGKIVEGDAEYNFIKDYVSKFEEALYGSNPTDPENGYRKYIDVRSWAKWYLVQELSGNMDTNHYFILRNHNSKLERGPVWDAEWSYGLAASGKNGWAKPSEGIKPVVQGSYRRHWPYMAEVFSDPYFVGIVKDEWAKLKPQMESIHKEMADLAASIDKAQRYNFKVWPILNEYTSVGLVYFGDWNKEVEYVDNFLTEHMEWFDTWLKNKPSI